MSCLVPELEALPSGAERPWSQLERNLDAYFSADVETDGPIPGPYSMLSFALVYAGSSDGKRFIRPETYNVSIYKELRPISNTFQEDPLQ
jgi:hypothetical protein